MTHGKQLQESSGESGPGLFVIGVHAVEEPRNDEQEDHRESTDDHRGGS